MVIAKSVPDATTLLHFRHLLEAHKVGEKLFGSQTEIFEREGWIMRGGSIIDATVIAAPSSTKNASSTRDPEMHPTKKGNQWYFEMKTHLGVDAGTGYAHTVTATAANGHDLEEAPNLVRADDETVLPVRGSSMLLRSRGAGGRFRRPQLLSHGSARRRSAR